MFEGKFCNHVDSVAMGSPLVPFPANHFMEYQEKSVYKHFKNMK